MSETIRTVKSNRFSIIDNQLLEDPTLSLQAKGLQAYLLSRPDGWTICPNHLATTCRGGVSQIRATLKELEMARYIHREQLRDDKGRMTAWISWIYENPSLNPHAVRALSASGKTASGKTASGKTASGKSIHINTESSKTESNKTEKASTNSLNPDASARESKKSDFEISASDPEPCKDPRISPLPAEELASTNNTSGEGDFSAPSSPVKSTSGLIPHKASSTSLAEDLNHKSRDNFDSQQLKDLVGRLVERYNQLKPEQWGKCTATGSHITRNVRQLLIRYREDVGNFDAAIANLEQEWGEACLALKSSKFYNSEKFDSGNINFLLNPNHLDRLSELAQTWRDRPQSEKAAVAKKMVDNAKNGIPDWDKPDVFLSKARAAIKGQIYKGFIEAGEWEHPNCPSREFIQTYYPQLLN